jgi:hypothetical protein
VTAGLQGVILHLISIEKNYTSQCGVYPLEGHMYIHDCLLDQYAVAKIVLDKAVSLA